MEWREAVVNELLPRVLENFRRLAAQRDASTVTARDLLFTAARFYVLRGKSRQGIQLYRDTIEILRGARGDEDPDTLTAIQALHSTPIYNLGSWPAGWGQDDPDDVFEDAERLLGDMADIQRRVLGTNSIDTWRAVWTLSDAYWSHGQSDQAQGRSEEAQRNYEKAEQLTRQLLDFYATQPGGPGGLASGVHMGRLAAILASRGKYAEAEEAYKTDLGWTRRLPGGGSEIEIYILLYTRALGWTQLHDQKYAEAEVSLREACNGLANPKNGFSDNQQRYACESELGASWVGQKKYAEAEPLLVNGYKGLVRTQRERELMYAARIEPRLTPIETAGWIARMYEEWGKPQQASAWRQKAEAIK
jgi:tetratricopeptide (TPR) repeat protein